MNMSTIDLIAEVHQLCSELPELGNLCGITYLFFGLCCFIWRLVVGLLVVVVVVVVVVDGVVIISSSSSTSSSELSIRADTWSVECAEILQNFQNYLYEFLILLIDALNQNIDQTTFPHFYKDWQRLFSYIS